MHDSFHDDTGKKTSLLIAGVYLIAFTWILILTQGLPIGDVDDWVLLGITKDLSWNELFHNLLRPWSKSEYWSNQVSLIDQISFKRTVHGILLKIREVTFGVRFFPFFIMKAFFFSGTVAVLFHILRSISRSLWFALFGILFFVLIPVHYAHILWMSDPATILHFFIILGMWIFYHLVSSLENQYASPRFSLLFGALFLLVWLCMKTKEPGLILPLTLGAFTVIHIPRWRAHPVKLFLLFLILGFLAFQIVPIEHLSDGRQVLSFRWPHLARMIFRNYGVGYDDEAASAFFSLDHIWPVSIARTFGFFSLWTLIFFVILYWIGRIRKPEENSAQFLAHPLVRLSAIWAMIEIALMGLFSPEPRFFSSTMIPLTILSVRLVRCASAMLERPWKYFALGAALFAWAWTTFYMNGQHVLWLRQQIGQRVNRYMNTAKIIYKDQFPERPVNWLDIGLFYCPAYPSKSPMQPKIGSVIFHSELPYEDWNKTKTGSVEEFEQHAQQGAVYDVTFSKDRFTGHPNVKLIATVSGINASSFLERIIYTLKAKKPQPLYIFKYSV